MAPRRGSSTALHVRASWSVALVVLALAGALCSVHAAAMSMDMPSDPVDGSMVMGEPHEVHLKNGQRLRFASIDTLQTFLKDPSTGLGDVTSGGGDTAAEAATTASALCPVCGMETSAPYGPQVRMRNGEQAIYTCSMYHAHQVHDEFLSFRDASTADGDAASPTEQAASAGFCSGSGTTMLNGFSIFRGGNHIDPCILLWFPGWILNSRARYLLGCVLVALCAIFNEYLLQVRRVLRKESNLKRLRDGTVPSTSVSASSSSEVTKLLRTSSSQSAIASTDALPTWFRGLSGETQHLVHCFLHGFTILLAYMLMLVSMTYDGVLFLCCIVGYIVGYYIFGERRDAVPESGTVGGFASA